LTDSLARDFAAIARVTDTTLSAAGAVIGQGDHAQGICRARTAQRSKLNAGAAGVADVMIGIS